MNELIKLNKVNGSNVTELRELYDRIESNVSALKTVGIQQEPHTDYIRKNTESYAIADKPATRKRKLEY